MDEREGTIWKSNIREHEQRKTSYLWKRRKKMKMLFSQSYDGTASLALRSQTTSH